MIIKEGKINLIMGKTANCIKMLRLLNDGRVHSLKELADELHTKERNLYEYKKELNLVLSGEDSEFSVQSKPGDGGGYYLERGFSMPIYKMTSTDKKCLFDLYAFAMSKKDFINKKGCMETMSKVFSMPTSEEITDYSHIMVDKVNSSVKETKIEQNYRAIAQAIKIVQCLESNIIG